MGHDHEGGHANEEHEHAHNPIQSGLHWAERANVAQEAVRMGGTGGSSFGQIARHMGEHSRHVLHGHGSGLGIGLQAAQGVLSPLAIMGGMWDMIEGGKKIAHADNKIDQGEGVVDVISGGAGVGSGVAGLAGMFGIGAGAMAAPVLGSFGVGVGLGKYGSDQVRDLGWLKDDEGKSLKPNEWAANNGVSANDWIKKNSGGMLGRGGSLNKLAPVLPGIGLARDAGLLVTGGSAIAGAGMAVGGAIYGSDTTSDIMMHPERYREVDGSPVDEAMKHMNKPKQVDGSPADEAMRHLNKYRGHK